MNLAQFQQVSWITSEYTANEATRYRNFSAAIAGLHYWAVTASRTPEDGRAAVWVIESGICPTKIEAVSKARLWARHWKQEHHKAVCRAKKED